MFYIKIIEIGNNILLLGPIFMSKIHYRQTMFT